MDTVYEGPDRRRSPRVSAEFIVIYKVNSPIEVYMWIGKKEINAKMLDLSQKGMAILTEYDLPVSAVLFAKFTLIDLYADKDQRVKTMEITGEVRYNSLSEKNEHRLGIVFTKIAEEDQDAIDNFVKTATNQ